MLKTVPFANALAVVGLGLYIICRVVTLMMPDLLFAVGQSWFHTFNMDAVRGVATMDLNTFLMGGITFGALAWLTGYTFASTYNRLAK